MMKQIRQNQTEHGKITRQGFKIKKSLDAYVC